MGQNNIKTSKDKRGIHEKKVVSKRAKQKWEESVSHHKAGDNPNYDDSISKDTLLPSERFYQNGIFETDY